MFEDRYGLAVTVRSAEAFEGFSDALDRTLALRSGSRPLLEAAVEMDDGFALAWAMLGLVLRSTGDISGGSAMLTRATSLADTVTERERSHIDVLNHFVGGRYSEARTAAVAHLAVWPGDAVILMYAHYLFNLYVADIDRRERHFELVNDIAERVPDDWFVLGELAFTSEENGLYGEARVHAERSLVLNPHNGAAAHALAHAYLETGDVVAGEAWLDEWLRNWLDPTPMTCHLTWHLALLRLADGRSVNEEVAEILTYVGRSIGVLLDGASLMWRLHLAGADGLPWAALENVASPTGFSFSNFHRAFVLAASQDIGGLSELSAELTRGSELGNPSASTCADVVEALRCFALNDMAAAADRLVAVESFRTRLGGSRAQLEVLEDTTIEALRRSGRVAEARERLTARVARRSTARDRDWLVALDVNRKQSS